MNTDALIKYIEKEVSTSIINAKIEGVTIERNRIIKLIENWFYQDTDKKDYTDWDLDELINRIDSSYKNNELILINNGDKKE